MASQAAPAVIDRETALERACELIIDAGQAGAQMIVFPAACIPGCPDWVWSTSAAQPPCAELVQALHAHAVTIPSAATDRICRAAQRARVAVLIGVVERGPAADAPQLYNALLSIDAHGELLGHYRAPAPPASWSPVPSATHAQLASRGPEGNGI